MKYCYLALVFLLLGACSSNQSVPEWTNSIVHDPLYFSALIKVPTTLPDYRERAQELAANEIAMQISTTIDTQIKLTQTEIMGISGSEYIAQIRSSSSAQIKNLTPTMSYKSKNIYYVLYRVNKAEYYAQRERQRDIAVATAHDLLVQYDTNIHKPAVAIPLLILALDIISEFADMDLADTKGNIVSDIYSRLHKLPLSISYAWQNDSQKVKAKLKKNIVLEGNVFELPSQNPLINMPMSANSEYLDFTNPIFSDKEGKFSFTLPCIDSFEAIQPIGLSICKQYYMDMITNPTARKVWQNLIFDTVWLSLEVSRPSVFLDYAYLSAFQGGYRESLIGYLANLNVDLAQKLADADFLLQIRVEAREGNFINNLKQYTANTNIRLSLIDPQSGATLNYIDHSGLKSAAKSRETAERNAESDAAKLMGESLLYRLLYKHVIE